VSQELLIQPIANKKGTWSLPSKGSAYDHTWEGGACSTLVIGRYKGCLNVSGHSQVKLDGLDTSGKAYVKPVRRNCGRFECPVCYETWVAKSAKRIEHRFDEYTKFRQAVWKGFKFYPKHVMISPPQDIPQDELQENMSRYRAKIYGYLKRVGVHGGALMYHPYRWRCWQCGTNRKQGRKDCPECGGVSFMQYYSPHFHVIGVGFIEGKTVKRVFLETGYVIKNINGTQRSVFRTAQYQLSHCARKSEGRAFTWFGSLSYLKFKAGKYADLGEPCPICGQFMVPVKYLGFREDPFEGLEEYKRGYLDKPGSWVPVDKERLRRSR